MEGLVRVLHEIGVPVAIIASATIFALIRTFNQKIAIASALLTLASVAAYIPIELYPKGRDAFSKTTLRIEPQSFLAFSMTGEPIQVSICLKNGETEVEKRDVPQPDKAIFQTRPLTLSRNQQDGQPPFSVLRSDFIVGTLSESELRSVGLQRSTDAPEKSCSALLRASKRIYVGQQWEIGQTDTVLGFLILKFTKITGQKAEVSLTSMALKAPSPSSLQLPNKGFDSFIFEGNYEVQLLVREADFTEKGKEWAAFTVISAP